VFSAADLANTAWAFASMSCLDAPLLTAISAAAIVKISNLDLYASVAILDVLTPETNSSVSDQATEVITKSFRCSLLRLVRRRVAAFVRELPTALGSSDLTSYPQCLVALRVASLGAVGTELLLNWMEVRKPPSAFSEHAEQFLSVAHTTETRRSKKGVGAASYVKWCVRRVPSCQGNVPQSEASLCEGELFRRNGLLLEEEHDGQRVLDLPGSLRAVRLTTTSPHTDRRLCSEIRLLEDVRIALNQASPDGMEELAGEVNLQISRPPCLSCACAIVQFRLLFPKIAFGVGF